MLQVRSQVLNDEGRADGPRPHRGMEVRPEVHGEGVSLGRPETIADEFQREPRGETIGKVLRVRSRDECLAHRVRPAVAIRIGDRVYRLVAKPERAETATEGTHAARPREGDARPRVFGAGDVGITR